MTKKDGYLKTTEGSFITTPKNKGRFLSLVLKWARSALFPSILFSCATSLPEAKHDRYTFPESRIYVEEPAGKLLGLPYRTLGWVRTKATWPTLEQEPNSQSLCRNYYNKAARNLLKEAAKARADAVIKVRSIVILMDGKTEEHSTAECSDDGAEGEILLQGIAIKFLPPPREKNR